MRNGSLHCLLIIGIFFIIPQLLDSTHANKLSHIDMVQKNLELSEHERVDSIIINGEQDFESQVNLNNWLGDGSESSPYLIEGYSTNYIEISNTNNIHFIIQNNTIFESTKNYLNLPKIVLLGVNNGIIKANYIQSKYYGIYLRNSKLTSILDNQIKIELLCDSCTSYGIAIDESEDESSSNNIVEGNFIDSYGSGIILVGRGNLIQNNLITYSQLTQWGRSWGHGIHVMSNENNISRNTVSNKYGYGILIQDAGMNTINENNFIANSLSLSNPSFEFLQQAGDYKSSLESLDNTDMNFYKRNYWSDLVNFATDNNGDNILETSYSIDNNWVEIEDDTPSKIQFEISQINNVNASNEETEKTDESDSTLIIPITTLIIQGMIVVIFLSSVLGYYYIHVARINKASLQISKRVGHELSLVFQNHPSMFYLILSYKNNLPTPAERDLGKNIPKEIFNFKFLMNPIRLAMTKLLYESIELTSTELKISLGLSWGDFSTHSKALAKQKYTYIREEFREGSVKQVITLTDLGYSQYTMLKSIISKFFANSPENYLKHVDKHYRAELNLLSKKKDI